MLSRTGYTGETLRQRGWNAIAPRTNTEDTVTEILSYQRQILKSNEMLDGSKDNQKHKAYYDAETATQATAMNAKAATLRTDHDFNQQSEKDSSTENTEKFQNTKGKRDNCSDDSLDALRM